MHNTHVIPDFIRAYRLIITNNPYAPENLWETEQPYIDNLSRGARAFGTR